MYVYILYKQRPLRAQETLRAAVALTEQAELMLLALKEPPVVPSRISERQVARVANGSSPARRR